MRWRLAGLLLLCCAAWTKASAIFPVCTLEYLANHSTQIVIGTITPGTATDAYTAPFDHVIITQVFKGDLKPGQHLEVQEVLSNFPSHSPQRVPDPLPFQVDSVLLFLVEQSQWTSNPRQPSQYFQISGGGPGLFSGDRAYACFQTMRAQKLDAAQKKQWPFGINTVLNPPDVSKNEILQQLDDALHPSAERLAIVSGDRDDPALVQARCELIKQRHAAFGDILYLQDDAAQQARDRIGRVKPFEQLDAMVMGPDRDLGYAVPVDTYVDSDIARQRLVQHLSEFEVSDPRFDWISMALTDGCVVRGYLAQQAPRPGDAPADTPPYPLLTRLAELATQPRQSVPKEGILLDRFTHLRDIQQEDAIRIDPACMSDINGAIKVLDDAANQPGINVNFRCQITTAAAHLRTFQDGLIPGRNPVTYRLPMVKIHLATTLLRFVP